MKTVIYWALLISITFLICIFLFEYCLRAIGLGNPIIYTSNLSYRYAPLPNQNVSRRRNAKVTINSSGLRATKEWDEQADLRILFIGDSVTWGGTYIDNLDIFSEKSCIQLNARLEQKFLCGNAGVNAYGTDNMARRIQHDSIDNEDWLVIIIIGGDTVRSLNDIKTGPWFLEAPAFLPAIQDAIHYSLWKVINLLRGSNTMPNTDKDMLYAADKSLNRLKSTLLKETTKGKQVLVIWHPTKQESQTGKLTAESKLVVSSFRDEPQLGFIDMSKLLSNLNLDNIYYDGVHLEIQGHDLFARAISDHIASNLTPNQKLRINSQ